MDYFKNKNGKTLKAWRNPNGQFMRDPRSKVEDLRKMLTVAQDEASLYKGLFAIAVIGLVVLVVFLGFVWARTRVRVPEPKGMCCTTEDPEVEGKRPIGGSA